MSCGVAATVVVNSSRQPAASMARIAKVDIDFP
jgi:hypothetical protein